MAVQEDGGHREELRAAEPALQNLTVQGVPLAKCCNSSFSHPRNISQADSIPGIVLGTENGAPARLRTA